MSILYRSAFGLAEDIKQGKLSAVEVLEFFLARIEQHNAALNAVVAMNREAAHERAAAADAAAARGEDWGLLHGVPLTIKDVFCTSDMPTVGGIKERAGVIPATNAIAVQRYLDAGAVIFGKTNVPFMAADLQSFNEVYGTTNNPWDVSRTCGGSSGGAAAALAAGLTPLELGSDIGGSIRTPSHFNGTFGHKPTHGLVSVRGHVPPGEGVFSEPDLASAGPMATCVADLEKALSVLAGPAQDIGGAVAVNLPAPSFDNIEGLRVAVWSDDSFCRVDREIAEHIDSAAACLERLGAQVDRNARPDFDALENHRNYMLLLAAAIGADMPQAVRDGARDFAAAASASDASDMLLQMRGIALSHYEWQVQNEKRQRTRHAWARFFRNFDVLLCPCTHVPAFPHNQDPDMYSRVLEVNGAPRPYMEVIRWAGLTINAYLPVTAVPLGTTRDGLPVGAQVVSRHLGDRTSLAVAALLESHHRAFVPPPGYST